MGLPQHQMVCVEAPHTSTTTRRPHGTHANRIPFLSLAISLPFCQPKK